MIGPYSSEVICEGGWLWAPLRYQQSIGIHIHCIKWHSKIYLEPTNILLDPLGSGLFPIEYNRDAMW